MEAEIEQQTRIELGRRILELRERLEMSQAKLAKRVGVERSRLSKWERGVHQPLMHHLLRLADILGVPIDVLFRGEIPAPQSEPELAKNVRHTIVNVVSTLNRLLQPERGRRLRAAPPTGRSAR